MATVFGVDLLEIETSKLIRDRHVKPIYEVLSGQPGANDINNSIRFTGSVAMGYENEIVDGSANFSIGWRNKAEGIASFASGQRSYAYADAQFTLANGALADGAGDAQRGAYVRSIDTPNAEGDTVVLPTRDNSLCNIKVRITAAKYQAMGSNHAAAWEYDLVFTNSRESSDRPNFGLLLKNTKNWESREAPLTAPTVDVEFDVDANGELVLIITDDRGSGSDKLHWSIYVDNVEVYLGVIEEFGYGYGYGYGSSGPMTLGSGGCFVSGSKITLSDGSEKSIEDISVGDVLLAIDIPNLTEQNWLTFQDDNINDYVISQSTVTDVYFVFDTGYYLINDKLEVTREHPLYAYNSEIDLYEWVQVRNINPEIHKTYMLGGDLQVIQSIQYIEKDIEAINVNVEEADVFFVDGFLVHNKN